VLYCNITSWVPTDPDQDLMVQKGGRSFPYLIFMDSEGNILAWHEGERDAEGFARTGKKATAFLELKARADKGDPAAQFDLAIAQLELGHITSEEARKKLPGLGSLSKAQQSKMDRLLVTVEVREILGTVTYEWETQRAAAKRFLELRKAGHAAPEGDEAQPYWILIMKYAEEEKDVAIFSEALQALKAKYADHPQAAEVFSRMELTLKRLQDEKK
jgi:hypothetical protein